MAVYQLHLSREGNVIYQKRMQLTPKSSNPSIGKGLRALLIGGQMTEGPESHPEGIPHQYLKKVEHLNGQ